MQSAKNTTQPQYTEAFMGFIKDLQQIGKNRFGSHFRIQKADWPVIRQLAIYFLAKKREAQKEGIDLSRGILLTGPVGCGKTTLMALINLLAPEERKFTLKSARDIAFEFDKQGFDLILKYSHRSYATHSLKPKFYCFDDLGAENTILRYGNECNVMGEILLSRYDLFSRQDLITHATTNLSATELEAHYGTRIRSRFREMFNLIAFPAQTNDKRKT